MPGIWCWTRKTRNTLAGRLWRGFDVSKHTDAFVLALHSLQMPQYMTDRGGGADGPASGSARGFASVGADIGVYLLSSDGKKKG
jgi:hypothetical protein